MSDITAQTLFGDTVTVVRALDSEPARKAPAERDNRPFAMTDMLFVCDKKRLWIEARRLLVDGYSPDELFPAMWWGIKSALFMHEGITADIKPYTQTKLRPLLAKIDRSKTYDIAISFLEMVVYSRTQPGVVTEHAFEAWILGLPL
jgi:hypothetical protein